MSAATAAKSRTRSFAIQALYQALLTDETFRHVAGAFVQDHNMKRADIDYFHEILNGIDQHQDDLKSLIAARLDRAYGELDPVEESILLLGCYELKHCIDVPYRVVINEGIELAKSFGATDSYRYVNSILDALAKDLRPHG